MSVITGEILTECQACSRAASPRQLRLAQRLGHLGAVWRQRIRDRQAFAQLDYRDLRDIGLSRWDVEGEIRKPFWRD